ncbi:hypothetical protein [Deminuibacter soli]
MSSNYDNWYCDKLPGEATDEFLNRSIMKSKNYIEAYQNKDPDKIFFVLVPAI